MFEFAWQWVLYLAPVPILVRRFSKPVSQAQPSALRIPFMADLVRAQQTSGTAQPLKQQSYLWWLALIAWILLICAAARPQWLGEPISQQQQGRDLMMAIDLSGSMQERDFEFRGQMLDRLTATRVVAKDFIQRRSGDRIGLVLFGDLAYLQAPLTYDRITVEQLLDEAQIGLAGESTAIGDAIGISIKRLRQTENPQKVLILLTDGTNTAGALEPLQAAQIAADEGVKIYTIGIGGERGSGLLSQFFQRGAPDLDVKSLTRIAEVTGGRFYRARNIDELSEIYELLDQLEPVERDSGFIRPIKALYHWPLAAAIALLLVLGVCKARFAGRGL